jgi:hypothetical protein
MLNRSDESGAIALIAALVSIVLMVVCAFVVDIGGTWARRGQLQVQADRAAVFAADYLPVADASDQKAVAAQVAYYIACHTVEGQRELTSAIPSCTSSTGPSDPAIKTYGDALLTAGQVSFPSATRIKVVTPPARVDFSFGQAAGADGTTQQKTAIAKVGSPGRYRAHRPVDELHAQRGEQPSRPGVHPGPGGRHGREPGRGPGAAHDGRGLPRR